MMRNRLAEEMVEEMESMDEEEEEEEMEEEEEEENDEEEMMYSSDSDIDGDSFFETLAFRDVSRNSLSLDFHIGDCLFAGSSSKAVWRRKPGSPQENVKMIAEAEFWFYLNYHMRPYLRQLIIPGYRYIVYVASQTQFCKISDESEKMFIWSSVRNQRYIVQLYDNDEDDEIYSIIDDLLQHFCREALDDITKIEKREGSGM